MLLLPLLLTLPSKFFLNFFYIYLLFILSIYSTEQVLDESGVSIAPPECSWSATTTILPPQPNITRLCQHQSNAIKKDKSEDGSDEGGRDEETEDEDEDEDEEETEVNKDNKDNKDNNNETAPAPAPATSTSAVHATDTTTADSIMTADSSSTGINHTPSISAVPTPCTSTSGAAPATDTSTSAVPAITGIDCITNTGMFLNFCDVYF